MAEIGLFEAIYSARSLRRLKPDPVPEELITKILDAAIRAPSGGNAQNWAFIVVRDPVQRQKLGAIYRKASDIAEAVYAARSDEEGDRARLTAAGFSERDIWDIAAVASFYNMTNRLASATDMRPNKGYHAMAR